MTKIKVLIKFLLLTCNISYVFSDCTMTIKDADLCGMKAMFFGNRNVIVATNDQELDQHCSIVRTNIKCIRDFATTCLTGFVRQTINMILTNAGRHIDNRCNNKKNRDEFMSHIQCLLPKEKMEPFHICTDKYMVMLEKLRDVNVEERIGAFCCTFHSFQECIRNNNKQICGEETSDYWDEVINEIANDSISFSCANFETVAKCDKSMNPKVWDLLKSVADSNDPNVLAERHKYGSGITLAVELMENYSM